MKILEIADLYLIMLMRAIVLAGGAGSRLFPLTTCVNKQLLPLYDKPMVYYPISTIVSLGIKEICLISTPEFIDQYKKLLFNFNKLGLKIEFRVQKKPNGIAESFLIAEDFIDNNQVCLILGDNIFHGKLSLKKFNSGALVFAYKVVDPHRYGVVEFTKSGRVMSIEEKPKNPKSKYAIPGLYVFDQEVTNYAKSLKPSNRGELEITDINKIYLENKKLKVSVIDKNVTWLDAGTVDSFFEATSYIKTIQARQGKKIGCIEEECLKKNYISKVGLEEYINNIPECSYKDYLKKI